VVPQLDNALLGEIRQLDTFDSGCDLESLAKNAVSPLALIESLVASNHVRKEEMCRFWADKLGVAYVDPFATVITDEARDLIPPEIATKVCVLPLYVLGEGVTVAMAHPEDEALIDRLSKIAKVTVSPVFALPADINDAIQILYCNEESLETALRTLENHALFVEEIDLDVSGERIAEQAESEHESWSQAFTHPPRRVPTQRLLQAEAACFSPDGHALLLTTEGNNAELQRYRLD